MTHNVSRWHHHPMDALRLSGDNITTHQDRCVGLLLRLFPKAPDTLVKATRHHDDPEKWLGDPSYTAKRDFPDLAGAWSRAEAIVIERENIPQPANQWEADVVKLVDLMDAYRWMIKHAPSLILTHDWVISCEDILDRAQRLGVSPAVARMIGL